MPMIVVWVLIGIIGVDLLLTGMAVMINHIQMRRERKEKNQSGRK